MRKVLFAAAAGALAMVTALAANPAHAQQQDNKKLIFSIPLPLTGPPAYTGALMLRAWQDAVDWINKTGGIKGREVEARIYDDEYNVNVAVAGFKKAVANGDVVFAGVDGTPAIRALSPENNEKYKVLMSNLGNTSEQIDVKKYPYHLLFMPTYDDMFQMVLQYIHKKKPGAKLAFVYSDTEYGRDPIENGHKKAKELGLPVVVEDQTKFTVADVTPTAIKLRNAAADYVIIHGYVANVWPEVIKLAREYGVKSQFVITIVEGDPDLVKGVGPAADGVISVEPYDLILKGSDKPIHKVMDGYLKAWTNKPTPYIGYGNIGYFMPWAQAVGLRQIIGTAIDRGLPLNGDNLIKVANEMKEIDMGGLFGDKPINFVQHRIPYGMLYKFQIKGDSFSMDKESDFIKVAE